MATTNFIDKVTVIPAEWANDVNAIVHDVFNGSTTVPEVQTILGIDGDIGMDFFGDHDASSNLAPTPAGNGISDVYRISVGGTFDSITYSVGDYTLFNGTTWEKLSSVSPAAKVVFLGDHDATAGAPVPTPNQSDTYRISVAGTFDSVTYVVGDFTLYNGTNWIKSADNDTTGSGGGGGSPFTEVVVTNSSSVDLVDTNLALNVGAIDPNTQQHIEVSSSQIQSKSNATTAAPLELNGLGGNVDIGAKTGSGSVTLYDTSLIRLKTNSSGVATIHSDGNVDTDTKKLDFARQDGTVRGFVGYNTTGVLQLRNNIAGQDISIIANDLGGISRNILTGDADASTALYYNGTERLTTSALGRVAIRSDGNTDAENRNLRFERQDGTLRGNIGYNLAVSGKALAIVNEISGADVRILGRKTGGALTEIFRADPDSSIRMYYGGVLRTTLAADGIVKIASDGNTDTETRGISLTYQNGIVKATFSHLTNGVLAIDNKISGGILRLRGNTSGGSARNFLNGDPNGDVELFHPASATTAARSISPSTGGLEVNNTITGAGLERVLTESDLVPVLTAVKEANTARVNTTVVVDDPHLVLTLTAGRWLVTGTVYWNETAGASQGIRLQFNQTTGLSIGSYSFDYTPSATSPSAVNRVTGPFGGNNNITLGDSTNRHSTINCIVDVTTAGTFRFRWAQSVSNANATNVLAGSNMIATKLS